MGFYSSFRSTLSNKNKGNLSKLIIKLGFKPSINREVISPFKKATIVFSADFEMAWAFRFSKKHSQHAVQKGLEERDNIPILLNLFDQYKIPITWATVGHLMLKECKRSVLNISHEDMLRPFHFENKNWLFNKGDWYEHDPCTNYLNDPAWYASDLIDLIMQSSTTHEIGCHSFSHIDLSSKNCPAELAKNEINKCIALANGKKTVLTSMVFPGGTIGNLQILKDNGFLCYRKPMKYHIDLPYIDDYGLVAIPSSLCLEKDPYGWTKNFHVNIIKKFLLKSIKHKLVCHFWFHPSMNRWYLNNVLPEILRIIANKIELGEIEVLTMTQLANKTLSLKK